MRRIPTLWKASTIAFISSFCVMVIELIASRILAPYIGVSLYTWTSIIGVILAGIALGNYLGGKVADRHPSPLLLAALFFIGALLTIFVIPATKIVTSADWFGTLPVMWNFTLKTSFIFFLPAIILSMVSPMVIKLALADLGRTGGVVGTIYACSTAGAILGTFMTGFYFILWFGTSTIVWLVAIVLLLTGILAWFSWNAPHRWKLSLKNVIMWICAIEIIITSIFLFSIRESWQESYTRESNYYAIQVKPAYGEAKMLVLDDLIHAYVHPEQPTILIYDYLDVLKEIVKYIYGENAPIRTLHLGGGGYSFPRYLEVVYPQSVNEVVEIDPAVTQVVYDELGLSPDTSIKTYNEDARRFLIERKADEQYDAIIGDCGSISTPHHLTTVEFDRLVKAHMKENGIYLVVVIDDYHNHGRCTASTIYTLQHTFKHVYLFSTKELWESIGQDTFVIAATDRSLNLADYQRFVEEEKRNESPLDDPAHRFKLRHAYGVPHDENKLEEYIAERKPILLTDEHAPTDILIAPIFQ